MPTLEERLALVETNLTEASTELTGELARLRTELETNGFTANAETSLGKIETMATALKDVVPNP